VLLPLLREEMLCRGADGILAYTFVLTWALRFICLRNLNIRLPLLLYSLVVVKLVGRNEDALVGTGITGTGARLILWTRWRREVVFVVEIFAGEDEGRYGEREGKVI
jgi:hypothetical protein